MKRKPQPKEINRLTNINFLNQSGFIKIILYLVIKYINNFVDFLLINSVFISYHAIITYITATLELIFSLKILIDVKVPNKASAFSKKNSFKDI